MSAKPEVLFTEEQIKTRLGELATEIGEAYAGEPVALVGLMKSCLVFTADLLRAIPGETTCHFLRATAAAGESRGLRTDIVYSGDAPYEGHNILLLTDIVDTGITLNFVLEHIVEHNPASLRVCALLDKPGERKVDVNLDKPGERKVDVNLDWTMFQIEQPLEDRFVVGYGLDFQERYRGLPYIGTVPRPGPRPEERTLTLTAE
jgi:hypoxanthine phosphoribosyltransferase